MAVFGDAIDLAAVRVHRGKYLFFQPDHVAMAPDGDIYFPAPVYRPDFAADVDGRSWLVHELVHVWQHQRGVNLILAAPFSRRYGYGALTASTRFDRLNIEQQAALVTDWYLLSQGRDPHHGAGAIADYRRVIPFAPDRASTAAP